MIDDVKAQSQDLIKGGFDHLLKFIISEIEQEANAAKTLKDSADETSMNLSRQIGKIEGSYAVFKKINDYANNRS